jgi:hypothetical protein
VRHNILLKGEVKMTQRISFVYFVILISASFLLSSAIMLAPGELRAATYCVSPSGDDANPGTAALPWKTIHKAAASVAPGDTVIIKDGVYSGGIKMRTPGSKAQPIVFRAEGKGAVIDGSGSERDAFLIDGYDLNPEWWKGGDMYVIVEGLTIQSAQRGGLRISCAHYVTVKNCVFANNGTWGIFTDYSNHSVLEGNECRYSGAEHGIYVSNSSDYPVIRGNICHHNYASGIQINADPAMPDGDGISTGALIEKNVVYENGRSGGAGINLASVRNSIIRNNLIYNNYAGGIAAWADGNGPDWGCKNNRIYNNTIFFRRGEGRWAVSFKEGSSGNDVRNNILCGGAKGGFEYDDALSLSGLKMDYNLLYSANLNYVVTQEDVADYTLNQWQAFSGRDVHSFLASPLQVFKDYKKANFRLKPGSPGINAGDPASRYKDLNGTRNDLGAYGGPQALK